MFPVAVKDDALVKLLIQLCHMVRGFHLRIDVSLYARGGRGNAQKIKMPAIARASGEFAERQGLPSVIP